MSEAYTPGLKIKETARVSKERKLPIPGEILVKIGDKVTADTIVARAYIPSEFEIINAAAILGLDVIERHGKRTCDLGKCMIKKEGDEVEEGEIIAKRQVFFGAFKYECSSSIKGMIEYISDESGQVILRRPPKPLDLKAYIPGIVTSVSANESVVIDASAAFIQGIFGIGGERVGELIVLSNSPDEVLEEKNITSEHRSKIIVGGSFVTSEALKKAVELEVSGIIVGGINDKDLISFVGHEIGVAVTGREEVGLTLIITEGFGKISMAEKTFNILKKSNNMLTCINGATQIRAGVIRPEIIIPKGNFEDLVKTVAEGEVYSGGLKIGTVVRIIRQPFFGSLATVTDLPIELRKMETESRVRVLEVELQDGKRVTLPRANVEIFEG